MPHENIWAGAEHFLQNCMCAQRRLRSACTGWSESSLGAHVYIWVTCTCRLKQVFLAIFMALPWAWSRHENCQENLFKTACTCDSYVNMWYICNNYLSFGVKVLFVCFSSKSWKTLKIYSSQYSARQKMIFWKTWKKNSLSGLPNSSSNNDIS